MTPERTKEVFEKLFAVAKEFDGTAHVERLAEKYQSMKFSQIPMFAKVDHLLFMGLEGQKLVDDDRTDKSMRWLGFLQGVEWCMDLVTLEELKTMNKPPEEKYDANRV